jgi:hypothetical protein
MENDVFYVYPQKGRDSSGRIIPDRSKAIAAKFLVVNGTAVVDPNPQSSMQVNIYRRLDSGGRINESSIFSNPHNYLIVPENYEPSETEAAAAGINKDMLIATALGGPETGAAMGLAAMTNAFLPGHEQDLQRGERWGIPQGEISPAFRDAASWNLGYMTQMTLLPNEAAVMGGGALNTLEHDAAEVKKFYGMGPGPTQKLDGPFGMSEVDYRDFLAGAASGKETEKATIPNAFKWLGHGIFGDGLEGKGAQLQKFAPDRPGIREATGQAGTPSSTEVQNAPAEGSGTGPGEALTDYLAVIAAAQIRAKRKANQDSGLLPRVSCRFSGRSFAPIGRNGAVNRFGLRAAVREGRIPERFVATQPTDGSSVPSPQTGAGQAIPHAASVMSDPQPNGNSEAASTVHGTRQRTPRHSLSSRRLTIISSARHGCRPAVPRHSTSVSPQPGRA